MNRILMEIVVDLICFLELSPDEVVDLDSAVQTLENVCYSLKQLSLDDRQEFVSYLNERIYKTSSLEEREFLRSLPENIGLRDDGEVDDEFH